MTLQPTQNSQNECPAENVREELLEVLLDLEEGENYPWNPLDPQTDEYFEAIEHQFSLLDGIDEEINHQAHAFFDKLNQQWSQAESPSPSQFRADLYEKFSDFLPKILIENIINRAEQLASNNLDPLNQVVECVQPLWSSWTTDDLQVFARPVVYTMRSQSTTTKADWEELTEFEQIRLTMTVAQEAVNKFHYSYSPKE
ncbi:MAG: hypothetical protein AB4041_12990 [Microcystaceae cyanobacterium]